MVLFDAINMEVIQVLNAHNNALTCLTFDQQGDLLATTSIRVMCYNSSIGWISFTYMQELLTY